MKNIISFFISIFCLSISLVSSVSVWKNRSLFFEEYIYSESNLSTSISIYCNDVKRLVEGQMTEQERESFMFREANTYYYVTLEETGEVFTNLPVTLDYETALSQEDLIVYQYAEDNKKWYEITEYTDVEIKGAEIELSSLDENTSDNNKLSGYVFVNTENLTHGIIATSIQHSLNQRQLLFVSCTILGGSFVFGAILFLLMGRKALGENTEWLYKIKIDIHIIGMIMSTVLFFFILPRYSRNVVSFWMLRTLIILFIILSTLLFGAIMLIITFSVKVLQYRKDRQLLLQNWENRGTKLWPVWLVSFILLLCWYITIVVSLSGRIIRIDYKYVAVHIVLMLLFALILQSIKNINIQYKNQIIESAERISKEQTEIEVPIIGDGSMAEIAMAINHIRESYIHSLEEQKKSERLKYELVTNISHDLRTPLTLVLNYIELLKREEVNKDKQYYIAQTEKNAEKLHLLINDLFDLSKLESGNVELNREDMDILLLWKQMQHEYKEQLKQRNLELIIECKEPKIIHSCDGNRIWRVFDNLLQNAIKYAMEHTRIYVYISEDKEKGQVHIGIKNIASERIAFEPEELFLRFKRGTEARETEGSGLGLAIAKSIVLLHGGNIRIETEGDMFKVLIDL